MGKLFGISLLVLLMTGTAAKADNIGYDISGKGLHFTFTLPDTFTPDAKGLNSSFQEFNVAGTVNGVATNLTITMGNSFLGMPNFLSYGSSTRELGLMIPGLFAWDGSNVDLSAGTWMVGNYPFYLTGQYDYKVVATVIPTPEPATLLLLGAGSLAALGFRRRKA